MNKIKFKSKILILFIVITYGIGIGYAYLNSSLYINGISIINANVWNISLDNLNVTSGSVVAIEEPTVNDTTTTFTVKLANKEDFYEFTIDVVNNGDYDAKLGSLVETTGLTSVQEQYFDYNLTYQNNEPIEVNQLVKKDGFVRLKSKVEYKEEVNIDTIPESAKILNLGFKVNYDLDDGNGIIVENNGKEKFIPIANDTIDKIGTVVTIGTEKFYVIGTEGDNVKLFAMMNITLDDNPYQSSTAEPTIFSDIGIYYEGSIAEKYVNNYKKTLEDIFGIDIIEARIIHYNDLNNEQIECSFNRCYNPKYEWIKTTSYWIDGLTNDDPFIYCMDKESSLGTLPYNSPVLNYGIRPVITISKDSIIVKKQ